MVCPDLGNAKMGPSLLLGSWGGFQLGVWYTRKCLMCDIPGMPRALTRTSRARLSVQLPCLRGDAPVHNTSPSLGGSNHSSPCSPSSLCTCGRDHQRETLAVGERWACKGKLQCFPGCLACHPCPALLSVLAPSPSSSWALGSLRVSLLCPELPRAVVQFPLPALHVIRC